MTIREVVLRVDVRDEMGKQKVMEKVASVPGIQNMAMDLNAKKLTVVGNVDAIHVADKLKKHWCTEILTVKEKADRKNGAPQSIRRTDATPKVNGKNVVPSTHGMPSGQSSRRAHGNGMPSIQSLIQIHGNGVSCTQSFRQTHSISSTQCLRQTHSISSTQSLRQTHGNGISSRQSLRQTHGNRISSAVAQSIRPPEKSNVVKKQDNKKIYEGMEVIQRFRRVKIIE